MRRPRGNAIQVCEMDHLVPLELGGTDGLTGDQTELSGVGRPSVRSTNPCSVDDTSQKTPFCSILFRAHLRLC